MTTDIMVEREIFVTDMEGLVLKSRKGAIPHILFYPSENEDSHIEDPDCIDTIGFRLGYNLDENSNSSVNFELSIENAEFLAKSILAMIEAKRNNR